ncbi:hypothetical protein L211DRAFT_838518 [Terfezia boudieri ATCC MYA-4762]|uniref:Uncharacterized protein n=1 Tax=Terfezia boudieri ATCC MYA-4762 TaxID=1051890 RepID=A0A3N4LL58_9PEZI|nr:hypothetical protein L211DRAFT_844212 [Terfezia boudieri ATCC MYA-4762]RPB23663.1 hypothetical protein L211DRAFT_838517 [Terfezia boudieri ATCC MYA-4762]RPB23664.1 hypothetical protein L211DRAFT_838518 [Terfezia boudieri ATCC MYA-4762]
MAQHPNQTTQYPNREDTELGNQLPTPPPYPAHTLPPCAPPFSSSPPSPPTSSHPSASCLLLSLSAISLFGPIIYLSITVKMEKATISIILESIILCLLTLHFLIYVCTTFSGVKLSISCSSFKLSFLRKPVVLPDQAPDQAPDPALG